MTRNRRNPNFEQLLDALRSHAFDVSPLADSAGRFLVSKNGAAAVLSAGTDSAVVMERPGAWLQGRIATLVDRGYQKFFRHGHFEVPATAVLLHSLHAFQEELHLLAGNSSLFNESLGTTSDLYQYDRVKGREAQSAEPARPWDQAAGH